MSDFGAILIIKKNSGAFTEADKVHISAALESIVTGGDYSEVIQNGSYKSLVEWGNNNTLCSMLTEYYDDEDSEEIREFAEEEDLEEASEIAEKLLTKIGNDFTVTAAFEDW